MWGLQWPAGTDQSFAHNWHCMSRLLVCTGIELDMCSDVFRVLVEIRLCLYLLTPCCSCILDHLSLMQSSSIIFRWSRWLWSTLDAKVVCWRLMIALSSWLQLLLRGLASFNDKIRLLALNWVTDGPDCQLKDDPMHLPSLYRSNHRLRHLFISNLEM